MRTIARAVFSRVLILALVVAAFSMVSATAEAQAPYTFTVIAESPGCARFCEGHLPGLAMNARGTVAFLGCLGAEPDRRCGIFTGRGGPLTLIAGLTAFPGNGIADNGPFTTLNIPSINSFGTVAFYGCHTTQGCGLFTGVGGAPTLVVGTGGPFSDVGASGGWAPGISSDGELAFQGCLTTGECGIFFMNRRGRINMIAEGGALAMNDDGVVAFLASGGLYTSRRGRAPVFVADVRFPQGFIATNIPAISGDGDVAFLSCFVPGCSPSDAAIFAGRAGHHAARLFVDAATFGGFVMAPAIDADGTVSFYGCRADDCGIFTGPDPVVDVVVQESGPLLGATVGSVCCFGPPFVLGLDNQIINRGRIAFAASLSDGRRVIVRADPVRSRR